MFAESGLRMAIESDDDLSITSATPIQQCIFWSLALAFMFKLISFVLVAVIIHYNEWLRINASNLDYVFIRGISYKDCAYAVDNTNQIECVKWLQGNKSEWTQFWDNHGVNVENVQLPSIWYANVYYICFLLLALYLIDMGAMLVMCCRQRQSSDDIIYQQQLTLLATFFIGVTYILVFIAVIYCRSDPFVKLQFPTDSSLGFGSKIFGFTMLFYFIAVGIQHAYRFQNFRPWLQHTSNRMRSTWRREPDETVNGRLEREVEMEQLKRT
ncbi:hypothetical protein M3Y98_00438400 [Aphelenchoides besseyi]|nr:hypothetical protein M3Y98_00438400 [Aphelenchoides besseyi]KAI6202323.1 hypothetical protein M3Y96_00936200 [Aphelenchoides besseyi]